MVGNMKLAGVLIGVVIAVAYEGALPLGSC